MIIFFHRDLHKGFRYINTTSIIIFVTQELAKK